MHNDCQHLLLKPGKEVPVDALFSDPSQGAGAAAAELCYQQQCSRSILLQTPSASVWVLGRVHSASPFNFMWLLTGFFFCAFQVLESLGKALL